MAEETQYSLYLYEDNNLVETPFEVMEGNIFRVWFSFPVLSVCLVWSRFVVVTPLSHGILT